MCSSLRGARRSSSGSDPSLFEGIFPSSQRRGGCAVNEKLRSHLIPRRRGGQFGANSRSTSAIARSLKKVCMESTGLSLSWKASC